MQQARVGSQKNWVLKAAEEADIELTDDLLQELVGKKDARHVAHAAAARDIHKLKAQLKGLLEEVR